jgi:hypothetical protein
MVPARPQPQPFHSRSRWDRKFESGSLHRRVQCEPDFPRAGAPRIVRGANLGSKLCDVLLPSICRAGPHSQRRMMMALEALD